MSRLRAALAMDPHLGAELFGAEWTRLASIVDLDPDVISDFGDGTALADVDVLLAGWGCPFIGADLLDGAPRLRAVLFAGGSASAVLDVREAARRRIAFTNAGEGNAQAVAEYTFAMIVLAAKRARYAERIYRERRTYVDREAELRDTGGYGRTIGLIGASRIGRRVARLLAQTDMRVLVSDPYAAMDEVAALGAVHTDLPRLLAESDVVSIHAPATSETDGMIGAVELDLLRDGATLINTARGSLIDHEALRAHLRAGRIDAVLDVTVPEPLRPDDELWALPNVTITPHIAGATGNELRRLGRDVVDELERFARGEAFVTVERVLL
ncbi:hydroxyacid dehydrogenase [Microbacterium karelineae]|uniref:hydroxyacid dehydrogenase n=1 Tax=Microbacterium karelineae TaxID=2654283 RepID=UPI0012EAAAC9|nr:hydroxyacid dehydrogenase [Microbacterium karelineae]